MSRAWCGRLLVSGAALGMALANSPLTSGQKPEGWTGVLDEHPAIQYAIRQTTDRAAKLSQALTQGGRSLQRDTRTGYLLPVLEALGVPVESQLLVFSKTGAQRANTSPHNPRAIFFDESVVVAYVPGAPAIELAAHDPQQGVVFYQMHAINLLTRLNWESRVASRHDHDHASVSDEALRGLVNELASYLLFAGEVPPSVPLTPRRGFAERLESRTPKDRHGRSLGQLDLVNRLLRYPCSYMVYSEAFEGLSPAVKKAVYGRMVDLLSGNDTHARRARVSADDLSRRSAEGAKADRRAVLEILRDTKPDFPSPDQ